MGLIRKYRGIIFVFFSILLCLSLVVSLPRLERWWAEGVLESDEPEDWREALVVLVNSGREGARVFERLVRSSSVEKNKLFLGIRNDIDHAGTYDNPAVVLNTDAVELFDRYVNDMVLRDDAFALHYGKSVTSFIEQDKRISRGESVHLLLEADTPHGRRMGQMLLHDLFGKDFEYRFDDPVAKRRASVTMWLDSMKKEKNIER